MKLETEIDPRSGFCNGVVRAVDRAESFLKEHHHLYSIGAIVHNSSELERLKAQGLEIIQASDIAGMHDETILIRAHGEPPGTYDTARRNGLSIIDCTCPVVLQLQKKVHETYEKIKSSDGQIVIFGKKGHAEVNGLVGQTRGEAIVIDSLESAAALDFERPIALFSQTTKDPDEYAAVADYISSRGAKVEVFDTICRQVAQRHEYLQKFARKHSVVLFVSGEESSNGKVLYELCRSVNPRTYRLQDASGLDKAWFRDGDSVGICGATSTPLWQLQEIFVYLQALSESK